jgi:hypothetical protein
VERGRSWDGSDFFFLSFKEWTMMSINGDCAVEINEIYEIINISPFNKIIEI